MSENPTITRRKRLWVIVNNALIEESKRGARFFLPKGRYITRRDAAKAYEFGAAAARQVIADDLREIAGKLDAPPDNEKEWETRIKRQAKEYAAEAVPEESEEEWRTGAKAKTAGSTAAARRGRA